jgi:hypothetical protein
LEELVRKQDFSVNWLSTSKPQTETDRCVALKIDSGKFALQNANCADGSRQYICEVRTSGTQTYNDSVTNFICSLIANLQPVLLLANLTLDIIFVNFWQCNMKKKWLSDHKDEL